MVKALRSDVQAFDTFTGARAREPFRRVDVTPEQLLAILNAGSADERRELLEEITPLLTDLAVSGSEAGLAQLGMVFEDLLKQANLEAVAWATDRAAELVGMKWVDGHLVENPNGKWAIDEATRDALRSMTTAAMDSGISNDDLANEIAEAFAFSDSRAEMIARTETAFADVNGNLIAWDASGVVESKEWSANPECCDECSDLDGETVPLGDSFPGGDPPLHPNCRCDVLPVLFADEQGSE